MAGSKYDKQFRLNKVSYLEFKHTEMDRVLTLFFALLKNGGFPSRLLYRQKIRYTVDTFKAEFLGHPEWFEGFKDVPEQIVEKWIETHLMDVVNRGKPNQAIAAPRPLHGYTYRFRNPLHCRDFGASTHLYEVLYGADNGGNAALEHLKRFFFRGVDQNIDKCDPSVTIDVETQALLRLSDQVKSDAPDLSKRESYPPLCRGSANLLADDVIRLLVYEDFIPRTVMVEYIKILFAFHIALYHLRLFKLLKGLTEKHGMEPVCEKCPSDPKRGEKVHGDCPYQTAIFADLVKAPHSPVAELSVQSASVHYGRIIDFLKYSFIIKQLDDFAANLLKLSKIEKPEKNYFSVKEILRLLDNKYDTERNNYFQQRLFSLLKIMEDEEHKQEPRIQSILDLKLDPFETYIECLMELHGRSHQAYIVKCLDSLFLKNRSGALITQQKAKKSQRRFILDSNLLEVLLQIAVLKHGKKGFYTSEIRLEELIDFIRDRYGIYIDRLPETDGFKETAVTDYELLKENLKEFKKRLHEIGFYRDLSDACITQTIKPRYNIGKEF